MMSGNGFEQPCSGVESTKIVNEERHWIDVFHVPKLAWLILAASLLITLIAWKNSDDYAQQRAKERFEFQVNEAENAIIKRFTSYEQVLLGGLGLFKASPKVERSNWHDYINTLQIDKFFPGTLGVGYAQWLQKSELPAHIEKIRKEGYADYTVRPESERDEYSAIIFLEPFNEKNQRAFGFDMYSESTRREAMSRARDTGETALSGKVTLVQESSADIQAGFLVYVPRYSRATNTVEERRQAIQGFVYSALRMNDLMQGILGVGLPELEFKIHDGSNTKESNLLYDSYKARKKRQTPYQFSETREINIAGHVWTTTFISNKTFDKLTASSQPAIVAIGGLVVSFLLFNMISSLVRSKKRAQELADQRMEILADRETQFKSITDSANDGIISTDELGNISYFNHAAQIIFDYAADEVMGQPAVTLFPQEYHASIKNEISQVSTGDSESILNRLIEIEGLKKSTDKFPIEFFLNNWRSAEKTNFTIIVRDITERKRIEKMKSEFVSTVSHELRTPLTVISGSLALLESGVVGALEPQVMSLIENAHRNAELLARLVNDLLDTEKLASGTMQFYYQECNILDLVKSAIKINQTLADQSNIKLAITGDDDVVLNVDPDRFNQVMTNLISNAIKFSNENNSVEVGVESTDEYVRVSVTDHGAGIPDEFHARIFNKFAQADSTDSRKYGGTGLGLSIAKYIVEKFGGTIAFTSVPGEQTVFYFDLPHQISSE